MGFRPLCTVGTAVAALATLAAGAEGPGLAPAGDRAGPVARRALHRGDTLTAAAQVRRPTRRVGAPAIRREAAAVVCPTELGVGVATGRRFCDILIGRDLTSAVRIVVPPHRGPALVTFDLHNRHTYSEQETRAGRAYAEYTAVVGVLTPDGSLLTRAVVRSEFRAARDLLDRIAGGAGPDGLKAVAPLGSERIVVEVPEGVTELLVLGERLDVTRPMGRETFTAPGRPVASLSLAEVEYRPAPTAQRRR